jgi:hypothetical protein
MGFLNNFFAAVDFPPQVGEVLVDEYKNWYGFSMAYNDSLLDISGRLVGHIDQYMVAYLVRRPSLSALDAVLASKEKRWMVISDLLNNWALCGEDQLRLVRRKLGRTAADRILLDPEFTTMAKMLCVTNASERAMLDAHRDFREVTPPEVSTYRGRWHPGTEGEPTELMVTRARSKTIAELATESRANELSLASLSATFHQYLGDGTGEMGARAWTAFMSLSNGEPNVNIIEMIHTAELLARSGVAVGM